MKNRIRNSVISALILWASFPAHAQQESPSRIDAWEGNETDLEYHQTRPQEEIIVDETEKRDSLVQTIEIDQVWAGHPVGFCLLTEGKRQYIAYYNADRHMVVGQRNLNEDAFHLHVMDPTYRDTHEGTSTVLGWDSHNYVTLGIDRQGYIHLSGNMHVHPLTYFRSTEPHDITSLKQVMNMTGSLENRVTYPRFMTDRNGNLIFHYRDGGSGNGNEIYNIYSTETQSWQRLLDVPLTDGEGMMNAYQSQPTLMADGWYHVWWVWRDTPDCSTNHDLSYMKSPDLKNWYNAFGEPVKLPATIRNKSLIVDPVPPGGGIINLSALLCLDENNKAVFIYHKYGTDGNLQLFVARLKGKSWISKQITNWDYRWEFSGGGSIVFDVRLKNFSRRGDGYYEFSYWHVKQGNNTLLLDGNFDIVGKVLKSETFREAVNIEGDFPGLELRIADDTGKADEKEARYFLKWESLTNNRDRPRPEPWPEPSTLYLYKLKGQADWPL